MQGAGSLLSARESQRGLPVGREPRRPELIEGVQFRPDVGALREGLPAAAAAERAEAPCSTRRVHLILSTAFSISESESVERGCKSAGRATPPSSAIRTKERYPKQQRVH